MLRRFAIGVALAVWPLALYAGVKVKVAHEPEFAFAAARTWSWHPDGPGVFRMVVTANDDVAPVKARFAPILEQAIPEELGKRGLHPATAAPPDLYVTYYALITAGTQTQTMGQFLPSFAQWGIPMFPPATQSLRVIEQGSLVIDLISPGEKATVWRGAAQAELHQDKPDEERNRRLREAVRELLRKYPPKQK
jgi:hypothetical protein